VAKIQLVVHIVDAVLQTFIDNMIFIQLVMKYPLLLPLSLDQISSELWSHPQSAFFSERKITIHVGSEVVTAVSTKMTVFWVVAPCSLVEVYRRFRGPCCLHHQGDDSSLVNFYQTTRRYNSEDSHLITIYVRIGPKQYKTVFIYYRL
jgi:hypothetical protein